MQFDNVVDYIWQTYHVGIPTEYVNKHAKPLTYLKLVRVLSKLVIDPTGCTAEQIFADANRVSQFHPERGELLFQLADLHEECEMLIRGSGILEEGDAYASSINS